jgi:serine/threonine-protein kinase
MDRATIGRYEVIAELGRGGFATVYRARDPMLDREVAVKVLHPNLARDPDLRERFVREGRALARVHHPNVVMVFDAGESADDVYLAMELISGDSLAALTKGQPMPLARVLTVVRQIAPALDAIHAVGLVHRDIKPANIMAEQPDWRRVVLLDLVIARAMDSATLTTSGMLVGTPSFLAPEQVDGTRLIGPPTDVYQLGATVYALLSGRPPFDGTTAEVLYAVVNKEPPISVMPGRTFPIRWPPRLVRLWREIPPIGSHAPPTCSRHWRSSLPSARCSPRRSPSQ